MLVVMNDMAHRLEVLQEFKADMQLTRDEANWLRAQGADLANLDIE